MGNNASQTSRVFRGRMRDLDYFDQLPPSARAALANAAFNWSSGAVFNRWRRGARGYEIGAQVAAFVAAWDARQIKIDRKRVWGIGSDRPTRRKQR